VIAKRGVPLGAALMLRVQFGVQLLSGDLHCVARSFVSRCEEKRRGRDSLRSLLQLNCESTLKSV
jgi:hypothetical protein